MAHIIGQKRNCPFDSDTEKSIKQIKCEPPIDVVNYVPKADIESDGSDIGDSKIIEEKPCNESAYWSSISTPEKPVLKHSTEQILKREPNSSSDDLLARFPHLPDTQKPSAPYVPLLPPALLAQSMALRQANLASNFYGSAWNTLAIYQQMLKNRAPMQPWQFAQHALSPVTSSTLTRTGTLGTSSTDSGSDQESELTSRPINFSTPIRGKTDSSKTVDSGIGELLEKSRNEKFQASISSSTPPSAHSSSLESPIEKKRVNKYNCKQCDYQAPSLTALKAHLREHDLPCKCPICHKGFTRQWLLEGHIRTHNGEKPFSCEVCGRAFADRSNMRSHRATHDPQRRYTCPHCHKSFSRKSVLQKHMSNRVCLKRKSESGLVGPTVTPPKSLPAVFSRSSPEQ